MKIIHGMGCAALLLAFSLDCGDDSSRAQDFNKVNIDKVRNVYGLYADAHGLKGPKSEKELRTFLDEDRGAQIRMGRMGIDVENLDDIFVSERDGQPFKIRYGLNGFLDHAIVFESEGVEGKRLIGFMDPIEVDNDMYEKYWNGKIKPKPKGDPGGAASLAPSEEEKDAASKAAETYK